MASCFERDQFSHEFSHILLSQFESWLIGDDIHFCYRRTKDKETGWIDSNLFQSLYRPDEEQFNAIHVLGFFQCYEMRLWSSLTVNRRENLESDFEESLFFSFGPLYPGNQFACLEKLKRPTISMLSYYDYIPDLETCKVHSETNQLEIDANVQKI
jgi:hypothetical protein